MLELKEVTVDNLEVEELLHFPFGAYRNHRLFSLSQQASLLHHAFQDGRVLELSLEGKKKALLGLRPSPWDTRHLGRPTARMGPLVWWSETSQPELEALIQAGIEQLDGYQIDLDLDSSDSLTLAASQACGFRLLDTRLTYLGSKQMNFQRPGRARFFIRPMDNGDSDALLRIAEKMFSQMESRFTANPNLERSRAQEVYLNWLRSSLEPDSDYSITVACRGEEQVGFLAYRLIPEVEELCQKRLYGRGLSAVLADAPGAYVDLLCETILQNYESGEAVEFEASLTNPQSFRVFEALNLRLTRSRYCLHRTV